MKKSNEYSDVVEEIMSKFKYKLWDEFIVDKDTPLNTFITTGRKFKIISHILNSKNDLNYRIVVDSERFVEEYIVEESFLNNYCKKIKTNGGNDMIDYDMLKGDSYESKKSTKKPDKSEIELFGEKYEVDKEKLLKVLRENGIINDKIEMFIPKIGEKYFTVERSGDINIYEYHNMIPNEGSTVRHNNAFKTMEEAEIKSDTNKSVFKMIENLMIAENAKTGYVADYENDKTDKCCFYYSYLEEKWYITNYKNITIGYCTSPESAEKILKYLKENNIKP